MEIALTINGRTKTYRIAANSILLDFLREQGFHEVKCGCRAGECGACLVLIDGQPINSCQVLTASVQRQALQTVRGIGTQREPHALQQALADTGAIQCGFCTPGMVISAYALLKRNPAPTREEVQAALDGNLCRCTGYVKIIDGILLAARRLAME